MSKYASQVEAERLRAAENVAKENAPTRSQLQAELDKLAPICLSLDFQIAKLTAQHNAVLMKMMELDRAMESIAKTEPAIVP